MSAEKEYSSILKAIQSQEEQDLLKAMVGVMILGFTPKIVPLRPGGNPGSCPTPSGSNQFRQSPLMRRWFPRDRVGLCSPGSSPHSE